MPNCVTPPLLESSITIWPTISSNTLRPGNSATPMWLKIIRSLLHPYKDFIVYGIARGFLPSPPSSLRWGLLWGWVPALPATQDYGSPSAVFCICFNAATIGLSFSPEEDSPFERCLGACGFPTSRYSECWLLHFGPWKPSACILLDWWNNTIASLWSPDPFSGSPPTSRRSRSYDRP